MRAKPTAFPLNETSNSEKFRTLGAYLTFCVWGHTMSEGARYDREEDQARSH